MSVPHQRTGSQKIKSHFSIKSQLTFGRLETIPLGHGAKMSLEFNLILFIDLESFIGGNNALTNKQTLNVLFF